MSHQYLVVTDLDGTLLDHHTYAWEKAAPALELLDSAGIPVVLCSSKTAAEMAAIRRDLGNRAPFIVENGAAVYLPGSDGEDETAEIVEFGMNRAEVLSILTRASEQTDARYTGFNDMTVKDVMDVTGLDATGAANALQREFTEPLLWQDSEESRQRFSQILRKAGLTTVQGGRFMHVSGGCDKGSAVNWLRVYYAKSGGKAPRVIVLGDSENDVSMLETADFPVLVKSPVKEFPQVRHEGVYKTRAEGPAGWNEAIIKILQKEGKN